MFSIKYILSIIQQLTIKFATVPKPKWQSATGDWVYPTSAMGSLWPYKLKANGNKEPLYLDSPMELQGPYVSVVYRGPPGASNSMRIAELELYGGEQERLTGEAVTTQMRRDTRPKFAKDIVSVSVSDTSYRMETVLSFTCNDDYYEQIGGDTRFECRANDTIAAFPRIQGVWVSKDYTQTTLGLHCRDKRAYKIDLSVDTYDEHDESFCDKIKYCR